MLVIITNTDHVFGTPHRPQSPSLVRYTSLSFAVHCLQSCSGLYLTDLTFCREGNPSHRASPTAPDLKLINFNKYHKLARIVQGMSFHLKIRLH